MEDKLRRAILLKISYMAGRATAANPEGHQSFNFEAQIYFYTLSSSATAPFTHRQLRVMAFDILNYLDSRLAALKHCSMMLPLQNATDLATRR